MVRREAADLAAINRPITGLAADGVTVITIRPEAVQAKGLLFVVEENLPFPLSRLTADLEQISASENVAIAVQTARNLRGK
jgi:hypothetical protein